MKRLVVLGLLGLTMSGCGGSNSSDRGPSDAELEVYAQGEIRERLKDPKSAEFTNVHVYRGGGVTAVCGYVNSKNSFGGMTGRQRFIVAGVTVLEEEMEDGGMQDVWSRFCR